MKSEPQHDGARDHSSLAEGITAVQQQIEKVRAAFDALLVREVQVFGGIPNHAGRTGAEQMALREAIAELLDLTARSVLQGSGEAQGQVQSAPSDIDFSKVTRLEVITEGGRAWTRWWCRVEPSVQDRGRTLKLFVSAANEGLSHGR